MGDGLHRELGDSTRLQKYMALFYEFEEIGLKAKEGYQRPGDLRIENIEFHWDTS